MSDERWVPVAGYSGLYEVSSHGRVRSACDRNKWKAGRIIKQFPNSDGYPSVVLKQYGSRVRYSVHRLVLESFVGPREEGQQCRHLDGNKQNSRLDNLSWGTHFENQQDKYVHDTASYGTRNGNTNLTEEDVVAIRQALAQGRTWPDIAAQFGIHKSSVYRIKYRVCWAHL